MSFMTDPTQGSPPKPPFMPALEGSLPCHRDELQEGYLAAGS